ncbi:hypothetical protein PWT90_03246 [Aphanocladium album]|nr:hypothetical protein PWT90_03246 [Aphanocladium album]
MDSNTTKTTTNCIAHAEAYIAAILVCLVFFIGMFGYASFKAWQKSKAISRLRAKVRRLEAAPSGSSGSDAANSANESTKQALACKKEHMSVDWDKESATMVDFD